MGLVAVLGFVLVMLTTAFFQLSMYFGGSKETRNAVDAGTLNAGKRAFEVKVKALGADELQFIDVADSQGEFGLVNINRVWAKAMLAAANAQAMQSDGQAGGAVGHAGDLFDGARGISDRLSDKLNTETNLHNYFRDIGNANSLRMLGPNSELSVAAGQWETSLTDRGKETNIEIRDYIMPSNAGLNAVNAVDATVAGDSRKWIPGYQPVSILGRDYCFVPFRAEEKTHLISGIEFKANQKSIQPLPQWPNPVPNAFSCHGRTVANATYGQEAISYVVGNPQRRFKLAMPHTFVHIKLEDNKVTWLLNSPVPELGDNHPSVEQYESTYPNRPDLASRSGTPTSAICGTLMANSVPLGTEYVPPTLDSALFGTALQVGNKSKLENALVQRINEMITDPEAPKFTAAKLHSLLDDPACIAALQLDEEDYYIFSPDGKEVKVAPKAEAMADAPWIIPMINHAADGSAKEIMSIESNVPLIGLVQVIPDPFCSIYIPPFGLLNVEIHADWKPGSGYDGCLGEVTMKHHTEVYLWGVAGPL